MTETTRHPAVEQLLRWFEYSHLSRDLRAVSEPFHQLAYQLADSHRLAAGPELTTALRKLLEAKDCAVRSALERMDQDEKAAGR